MNQPFIQWSWIQSHITSDILPALAAHALLSGVSVAIALLISLPLGVYAFRHRVVYTPITSIAGVLYTIPSLSLFILLISIPGIGLGQKAAIIALVLYSLLVLIRNVVAGLDSVPSGAREAARGMGLTSRQMLWRVEIPLALPVIVAGVRIATVTVIGIATIAAYIDGGGLGTLIFDGINQNFTTEIVVGAGLATLLAVVVDLGLIALQRQLRPWAR